MIQKLLKHSKQDFEKFAKFPILRRVWKILNLKLCLMS